MKNTYTFYSTEYKIECSLEPERPFENVYFCQIFDKYGRNVTDTGGFYLTVLTYGELQKKVFGSLKYKIVNTPKK